MNILIIGAGAVGQVYGRHLARAGHAITFFVKPAHRAALEQGLPLHRLGWLRHRSETWRDYALLDSVGDIASRRWDQVWICVSADALAAPLTRDAVVAAGPATVVCLQPGPESAGRVREWLADPRQLVQGLITFISYQSPLPGRPGPQGLAYFLPPLAPGLFAGADERVGPVLEALRRGGMGARRVADFDHAAGGSDSTLIPLVAALEVNGWQLDTLAGSEALALGRAAAVEALDALAADRGARVGPQKLLLAPPALRALLFLAPKVLPLALGPYLAYHFSKVGRQTREMLESYIAAGQRQGLPVARLQELRSRLP